MLTTQPSQTLLPSTKTILHKDPHNVTSMPTKNNLLPTICPFTAPQILHDCYNIWHHPVQVLPITSPSHHPHLQFPRCPSWAWQLHIHGQLSSPTSPPQQDLVTGIKCHSKDFYPKHSKDSVECYLFTIFSSYRIILYLLHGCTVSWILR